MRFDRTQKRVAILVLTLLSFAATATAVPTLYGYDNGAGKLVIIDQTTGATHPVTAVGSLESDTAIDVAHNRLFYLEQDGVVAARVVTVDLTNGVKSTIPLSLPARYLDLEFDPVTGLLFTGTASFPFAIFTIDPASGVMQLFATTPALFADQLALDSIHRRLFFAARGDVTTLYKLDLVTQATSAVTVAGSLAALRFDVTNNRLLALTRAAIISVDPATGGMTTVAPLAPVYQLIGRARAAYFAVDPSGRLATYFAFQSRTELRVYIVDLSTSTQTALPWQGASPLEFGPAAANIPTLSAPIALLFAFCLALAGALVLR